MPPRIMLPRKVKEKETKRKEMSPPRSGQEEEESRPKKVQEKKKAKKDTKSRERALSQVQVEGRNPKAMPGRRPATKKGSRTDSTKERYKAEAFESVLSILDAAQDISSSRDRVKLLQKFESFYYCHSTMSKTLELLAEHQKYCARVMWRVMAPVFALDRRSFCERIVKFFTNIVLEFGLEDQLQEYNYKREDLPPFYIYALQCIRTTHNDERHLVRIRIIELAKAILDKFHNDPAFTPDVKNDLLDWITIRRVRDKIGPVRVQTLYCLEQFQDDPTIRKRLLLAVKHDPSADVKRTALAVLQNGPTAVKIAVLTERAFDASDAVRAEAFEGLSKVSIHRIRSRPFRAKIAYWGLTQQSEKVRRIASEQLIPSWLEECNKSVLTLFIKLDLSSKPFLAQLILDALYANGTQEYFERVDLCFLSAELLIPVTELCTIKTQLWYLLCKKFKDDPICMSKLLPEAIVLCSYIEELIACVHTEHEKAKEQEREEDMKLILCLVHVLRISEFIPHEETARRTMAEILKKILLDPILDESIIVNVVVDVAAKLMTPSSFEDSMMYCLRQIFEGDPREHSTLVEVDEELNENNTVMESVGEGLDGNRTVIESQESESLSQDSFQQPETPSPAESQTKEGQSGVEISSCAGVGSGDRDASSYIPISGVVAGNLEEVPSSLPSTAETVQTPWANSTPIKRKRVTIADKIRHLKGEISELVLSRHRLVSERDAAVTAQDFLRSHAIQVKISDLTEQEKRIQAQVLGYQEVDTLGYIDEVEEERVPEENDMPEENRAEPEEMDCSSSLNGNPPLDTFRDEDENEDNNGFVIGSVGSVLKGLVLLARFLSWTKKINPFIRSLYANHIIQCLEDDEGRVRAYTIFIYCLIGIAERAEARKAMTIVTQALTLDNHKQVQSAAFKSLVDLLIHYKLEVFRQPEVNDNCLMLPPFNDPKATTEQLQEKFLAMIKVFGGAKKTPVDLNTQVIGYMKLLIRGAITNIDIISNLLCMWINPFYSGAPVCYHIGHFVPIYSSLSMGNACRMMSALMVSLRRIVGGEEKGEESDTEVEAGLRKADQLKLIDFVAANTDEMALQRFNNSHRVHEIFSMAILDDIKIKENLMCKANPHLVRAIKSFTIVEKDVALKMKKKCEEIYGVLGEDPYKVGSGYLRRNLKSVASMLVKKFGRLGTDTENDSDDDVSQNEDDEEYQNNLNLEVEGNVIAEVISQVSLAADAE